MKPKIIGYFRGHLFLTYICPISTDVFRSHLVHVQSKANDVRASMKHLCSIIAEYYRLQYLVGK